MMNGIDLDKKAGTAQFRKGVKERSDKLVNIFLCLYFAAGIIFAFFYDTWMIAFAVGSISVTAYYSSKTILPESNLYQYVLSVVLGIFMAQYIYQMHGLFEMHFFAFIGSAILITYQNWKLQIPMLVFVIVHHLIFGYLQNSGFQKIYFTQLDSFEIPSFIIHILLSGVIFFVCGLWGYQLKKYSEKSIIQSIEVNKLQKETYLLVQHKQSEQRFSALIQKGADMISILDENLLYKYVSPSVFDYLGYTVEEMLNRNATSFIHTDDVIDILDNLKNIYTQKEISLPPFRCKHANGKWCWVETIVRNMLDDPSIAGIVCNTRDITKRKQQELERELIIKELTKSNADLKQFTYITSHNLRAPLSNITGILSIIDYNSLNRDNLELTKLLQSSTKQLSKTIDDLTNILLIKNNTEVEINDLDVEDTFDYVNNIFAEPLKEVNGLIETNFVNRMICFNRAYLESIFINLISNAIKYHSPDRKLVLKISCKTSHNKTVLTFTDNGSGIDIKRHKDRLFGLYQRFHSNTSGNGLGLFIIKEQIAALGGNIAVESQPGEGTAFIITLKRSKNPKVLSGQLITTTAS